MTILVDMDDVLINFLETWVDELNREYGTSVKYDDITEWNMAKFFSELSRKQLYDVLSKESFWEKTSPKDKAVEYLKKLIDDGHQIYVCTATYYTYFKEKFDKALFSHFGYLDWDNVIVAKNKQMIKADVLIDDGIHNLEGGDYIKIIMTSPHNKSYDAEKHGMIRVNNWEDIYSVISLMNMDKIVFDCPIEGQIYFPGFIT